MFRRTKILATLGPATDDPKVLDKIIEAGVDVVRINFSHGTAEEHLSRAEKLRSRARAFGRQVGVLADLQGPQIRIERFLDGAIELAEGDQFIFDASLAKDDGDQHRVGISYKALVDDVKRGDNLLVDDGRLVFWVDRVEQHEVVCRVIVGGKLSDRKGINLQGGGLSAPALSKKDKKDIKTAAQMGADYLAVSFPVCADDIHLARKLFRDAGGHGGLVAKIERAEALDCIEEIIEASDAIMIARGDLGVEIGDASLPPIQKRLISLGRTMNRVVITATQMMESMIENQIPTRAEVFDVANAVLDGTDAVMLSAETAAGKFPEKAIIAMDRICREAEKQRQVSQSAHRIHTEFTQVDEAIAMSTMYTANHLKVKAIVALTESGSTTLWMSRIGSGIPIFAFTGHVDTRRKVTLYRGVVPVSFDITTTDHATLNMEVVDELKRRGSVRDGDRVIITKGDLAGVMGGTNAMKIVTVGELVEPDFEE
ncbi:MAG: pyruvate kinase [gamma proteobacterium symbiont of Lucinoma myriamae]|nr:pyruvate kinase [gamma proteobacterium symbiont of Lucinoma myriamae]